VKKQPAYNSDSAIMEQQQQLQRRSERKHMGAMPRLNGISRE